MQDYNVEEFLQSLFDSKESSWKPAEKIPLISKEIEHLKFDVKEYLASTDFDLESIVKEGQELFDESKALVDHMRSCKQEIEEETMAEIVQSIEYHDMLSKELGRVNFTMNIIYDVLQCSKFVKEFEDARELQSFSRAIETVNDLMSLLDHPADGFQKMELCNNTKATAELIFDNLLHDMLSEWNRLISWNVKPCTRKTIVTITLAMEDNLANIDILNAFVKCNKLDDKIQEFAQFLLKEVLIPIIQNDCTVFGENDELMTVTINQKSNFKPQFHEVISNLRILLHFLSNKLKIEYERNKTIMSSIGECIGNKFRDVLVNDCLIDTVPNNINELQNYGKITSEIADFQDFLAMVKLFPDNRFSILEYMCNIDVLFAEKSSYYFLDCARTILLKDLSMTMSIGVENIPEDEEETNIYVDGSAEEALVILDKKIPKSLFYFPRCMISRTAQEFLDLVYVMMEQAVQCSDLVCRKLYLTARAVFELYDAVVPYHHEKYLQTIPQYVALFHNNCMYLAHNLQTIGDKWMMLMEGRELTYSICFIDLVQKLRDLGYKHLTIHMQQQRKQILDNIRTSDLNSIIVKDVLGDNAEAAVRQCLRQLQLLKNVWIGVFPANVFTRLMGTLVNMFVDELIHRVCTAEDISAEMATQLTDIYSLVVQKIPVLFQSPKDVETNVKTWIKLRELIFILGGNLKEIEAHWADGTGPLAKHFRTEELRNLIKALFQNTQFRANLLSKIK